MERLDGLALILALLAVALPLLLARWLILRREREPDSQIAERPARRLSWFSSLLCLLPLPFIFSRSRYHDVPQCNTMILGSTMSKMTLRATYSLDQQTEDRIRQLAADWRVSKAEVIRRSVCQAVEKQKQQAPTPAEVVARYRNDPLPRSAAAAREWARANRHQRHAEDAKRTGGAA